MKNERPSENDSKKEEVGIAPTLHLSLEKMNFSGIQLIALLVLASSIKCVILDGDWFKALMM